MSGAEQMVREIVTRLGDKYDITLVTGRYDKANAKTEDRPTFKLIRVGIGHKQLDKLLYILLGALKVRELKPQIAHAIMESYAGGALVLIKWLAPGVKRILTLQSGDLDDERKQKQLDLKLFWKIIHRSPDLITAISNALAKRAQDLGVKKEKIVITPNGVDLSVILGEEVKVKNQVVCVARLSWEKDHQSILTAWPKVVEAVPGATLVFVGEGDKRTEIETQIKELGIESSVILRGLLPHPETMKEIKRSEVFICPSLAEGLGLVFVEAQACGVPPIGTRVGGIPDVIQHEENGLLIEPKNPEQISEAIIRLLKDKELANKLAKRGLETCQKFEWQKIIEQIDNIYKNPVR